MKIRVLSFASAGDAVGRDELELELEPGATVGVLKARLNIDYPNLQELWERLAVAVDGELVGDQAKLTEGCEVALLPPVSGGLPADREGQVRLIQDPISVEEVVASVADGSCGAVVVFVGTVRDVDHGRVVERLEYFAYRSMARSRLQGIVRDFEGSICGLRMAIVHRLGLLEIGEVSVVIAVASPHRAAGYEANSAVLERVKTEVPIWKREHYADGEQAWREEEALTFEG